METCVMAACVKIMLSSSDSEMKIIILTYEPRILLNLCLAYISFSFSCFEFVDSGTAEAGKFVSKRENRLHFFLLSDRICLPVFSFRDKTVPNFLAFLDKMCSNLCAFFKSMFLIFSFFRRKSYFASFGRKSLRKTSKNSSSGENYDRNSHGQKKLSTLLPFCPRLVQKPRCQSTQVCVVKKSPSIEKHVIGEKKGYYTLINIRSNLQKNIS